MSNSVVTLWTVAHQAPLSTEFSRQEYKGGLPFPSPGDFPDPGIELASPRSPALAHEFFATVPPGKPQDFILKNISENLKKPSKQGNPKEMQTIQSAAARFKEIIFSIFREIRGKKIYQCNKIWIVI